jgi:hypothetical protein
VLRRDERSMISGVIGSSSLGDAVELGSLMELGKTMSNGLFGNGIRGYLECDMILAEHVFEVIPIMQHILYIVLADCLLRLD